MALSCLIKISFKHYNNNFLVNVKLFFEKDVASVIKVRLDTKKIEFKQYKKPRFVLVKIEPLYERKTIQK